MDTPKTIRQDSATLVLKILMEVVVLVIATVAIKRTIPVVYVCLVHQIPMEIMEHVIATMVII